MKKKQIAAVLAGMMTLSLTVPAVAADENEGEEVTLLIAAAASLEYSMEEKLIPLFEKQNPGIRVEGSYDSSGKLQTQIEEGMEADLFFSAATKQMDALTGEGYMKKDSEVNLLENRIVAIVPKDSELEINGFEDLVHAKTIALGDPGSVPAGQYAKEALTSLNLWKEVSAKASFGTNVTEVLNWVAEGSAEAGVVYATDAAARGEDVEVKAEAPEGSLAKPVIYPAAILERTGHSAESEAFLKFLQSDEAGEIFSEYGFTLYKAAEGETETDTEKRTETVIEETAG